VDRSGHYQVFVVSETKGVWGAAAAVPGMAALNVGGSARLRSLSCGAARNCVAAGLYLDRFGKTQGFVVRETKGHWGKAIAVPGTAVLNVGGNARVYAVSCASVNECVAGGSFRNSLGLQAFVADASKPCVVPHLVGKTLRAAKKSLSAAHCGVGKIKRAYAKTKSGRVVAQAPKARRHLKGRSKVALTLSRGTK
jgi:hypothetical protein